MIQTHKTKRRNNQPLEPQKDSIGLLEIRDCLQSIDRRLTTLEEDQAEVRQLLARYEGGFRGVLLTTAGMAAALGLWLKFWDS